MRRKEGGTTQEEAPAPAPSSSRPRGAYGGRAAGAGHCGGAARRCFDGLSPGATSVESRNSNLLGPPPCNHRVPDVARFYPPALADGLR